MHNIKSFDATRFKCDFGRRKANVIIIISLGKLTSHRYKYLKIGKTCKGYKENCLIPQGKKDKKNICYFKGHSLREMLEDSKVKM